jgi:hypothetical protein
MSPLPFYPVREEREREGGEGGEEGHRDREGRDDNMGASILVSRRKSCHVADFCKGEPLGHP